MLERFVCKLSNVRFGAEEWISGSAFAFREGKLTMPVAGSTIRETVSTAMTWLELLFQGQYFRQFAVDTSSQE